MPEAERDRDRGSVVPVAGGLFAAASLGFLGFRLWSEAQQLPAVAWNASAAAAALMGVGLVVLIEAVHSLTWRTLARGVAPQTTWRESFAVCGRSQIAKYLPGNVFHFVQRILLARDRGLGAVEASGLAVVDALLIAAAGALVGAAALPLALPVVPVSMPTAGAAGLIVLVGALIAGGMLAQPGIRRRIRGMARVVAPRRVTAALALNVVPFLLAALSVHLVLHGFWPGASDLTWGDFVPGFAFAFVVGFVTPGAPGGVGVRELVLYLLYAPALGGALAAGLFLLLRVVHILGDAATFAVASWVHAADEERSSA